MKVVILQSIPLVAPPPKILQNLPQNMAYTRTSFSFLAIHFTCLNRLCTHEILSSDAILCRLAYKTKRTLSFEERSLLDEKVATV